MAATTYPIWTDAKISFQLPPTAKTGNIIATVNGLASNGVPFTVRAGKIYFVSPQGNDTASGSVDQPWRTLEWAVARMAAGDIVYVRDGYVDAAPDANNAALSLTRGGTQSMPFAIVAYPGAKVTIGSSTATAWGIRGMRYAHSWILAGLQVRGLSAAVDLVRDDNWRLVGNDLSCPNGSNKGGCLWVYASANFKALANTIHDTGSTSASSVLDYQSVWIESSNNLEFSWNTIKNTRGCNAVFLDGNGSNYGITLDGNRITDARCDGVKIAGYDTTKAAAKLQNNILVRVGTGPAPAGGEGTYACFNVAGTGSTPVSITHNTLYDCGRRANSNSGALKTSRLVRFDHNVVALASSESYVASSSTSGTLSGSKNLFWGAGAAPSVLTSSFNADPQFVSAATGDLQLSPTSPAIDAATAVVVAWDARRMSRPFGAAPDLGAYEYTGTSEPTATRVLTQQPTSLSFGSVATYSNTTKQVTVSNTGTEAVSVSSVTSTNSSFQVSSSAPVTLQPGQSTAYSVIFAPSSAASYSGTITVYSDAHNSPLTLAVSGTAATQGTATLAASPTSLAFGEVAAGTTVSKAVTISNTGTLAASISAVNVTGSGFSGSSSTLPITLAAGASTTVTVRFSPTSTSSYGNLEVVSNATNSPLNIQLSGTAATAGSGGRTFYVDSRLTTASCSTYSVSARTCGGGTAMAYRDLNSASGAAFPGDTVLVRGGSFGTQFTPQQSGTQSSPITFKAYPNETVTITGVSAPALYILSKSHLVIDGFVISNVTAWGRIETSNNITIKNSKLSVATSSGTTGSIKFVSSHYNRLLNNLIEDGNDNVYLQDSNSNLIQGNTIRTGRHTLLNISCGNYNVVRGNTFHNASQKAGEVYDCEGTVSNQPVKLDATKRNLWENNRFTYTRTSTSPNDYNGIQFAGQDGVVRRNVFYDNQGGGLRVAHYSNEALYVYGNRIYNNTFYGNHCYGLSTDGDSDSARYYNNDLRNNLHYRNTDCSGGSTQMANSNATANTSTKNTLFTTSPGFVNETTRDFRLAIGSPAIDTGAFLTTTVAAGSGTSLKVADARYFFDGFGIAGEVGDTIQLQGSSARARVVRIDYATNTLTLNASLTWSSGQGVALAFGGNAPDVGAHETDGTTTQPAPAPAGNVTANPTALTFGSVLLNSTSSKALVLTNNGGTAVTVSQLSVSNGAFSTTGTTLPLTIAAGGSTAVTLNFNPTAIGTYTGTLTAANNGSPSTVSIPLSGSGFEATAGTLTPGPSSISFGTISTGTSTSSTLKLTNTGGSNLSISQLASSSAAFSASGVSLPVTLAPLQSINVTVTFRPPSAATYQSTLTVSNTGSPTAVTIGLLGTAAAAEVVTPPTAPTGWQAPVGIPAPTFGITQTGGAPNCFVDSGSAAATDISNPRGTFTKPRRTIPTTLTAGDVCEVKGTYTLPSSTTWTMQGTAANPVVIRGINKPTFNGSTSQINMAGQFFIVEGLKLVNTRIRFGPSSGGDVHYVSLRNSEITGWAGTSSTNVIGLNAPSTGSTNVVVYNNHIHDNGSLTGDADIHGFKVGGDSQASYVWFLNNTSYRNGGDTVQLGSATSVETWPHHLYVGGNLCHDDRENCVDVKQARDVVISQNEMYGYREAGTSHGEAVVIHNGSERISVLYNTIHDSRIGVIGTGMNDDFFIIGNVFYRMVHDAVADTPYTPSGLANDGAAVYVYGMAAGKTVWVVNNTVFDSDRGIHCADSEDPCSVTNNLVWGLRSDSTHYGFATSTVHSNATVAYNLTTSDSGKTRFQVGSTRYTSLSGYQSATGKCNGCVEGNPLFVNTTTYDLRPGVGSPALNRGTESPAYARFQSIYNIDIRKDRNGKARPTSGWDIGAYEVQ